MQWPSPFAAVYQCFRFPRLRHCRLGRNSYERVEDGVQFLNAVETTFCELHRGEGVFSELGAELGYDAAWVVEHHFSDYYPTPSPLLLLSHIAARCPGFGLGTAVLEGFAAARTEVVGVMDGDLSHPPQLLPKLFRTIEDGFDLVVASRYVRGGGTSNFPIGRWLLSRAGCWLARPLTPVRDAMSGYFLVRRSRLDEFRTSVKGFKIGLELFVRSQPRRLAEVGYVFVGRTAGESKMSVAEGTGFLRQLASLYRDALAEPAKRPACVTVSAAQERAASASGA
jgi:hypothetical protein